MYHSVTFIMSGAWHPTRPVSTEKRINSWGDWHLIPTSRPVIVPSEVKTEYENIPIFDGAIDLSQTLTNDVCYKYREGELEFLVDNGHREWYELYSEIADVLHGQFGRIRCIAIQITKPRWSALPIS